MDVQSVAGFERRSVVQLHGDGDGCGRRRRCRHAYDQHHGGCAADEHGTLALVVDEKDLADGTTAGGDAGGDPDTQDIEQGGLVFTSGSDAIASIKFDLAAGQPTTGTGLDGSITWALSGDGLTLTGSIGATAVITLVLSGQLTAGVGATAAPTVTATLLSEFPHVELPAMRTR